MIKVPEIGSLRPKLVCELHLFEGMQDVLLCGDIKNAQQKSRQNKGKAFHGKSVGDIGAFGKEKNSHNNCDLKFVKVFLLLIVFT